MSANNIFPSNWENLEAIGKGGSSTVFKAALKASEQQSRYVAVKQIDVELLSKSQLDAIRAEIETMKTLSSTNIVQYYGMQETQYRIYIVMEYADCGSIRQFYNKNGRLFANEAKYCLQHIVSGLSYLHERGIAHRDVKCANCLMFSSGIIKLADFGASKRFESQSIVSGLKGTPHWMAPEVIKGTQMTDGWMKADVWSLGCTAVEMITGRVPYSEFDNPMTAMYRIANGEIPKIHLPDEQVIEVTDIIAFVHLCCIVNAEERPSLGSLKLHPILCITSPEVPQRLFDSPDLVDVSTRVRTKSNSGEGLVDNSTTAASRRVPPPSSEAPSLQLPIEALTLPQDIPTTESLDSFPTPALYARKRIINFAHCDSTENLALAQQQQEAGSSKSSSNNSGSTPGTAISLSSPLSLQAHQYNTASTTNNNRSSASRESTAPSFSYVNIQPAGLDSAAEFDAVPPTAVMGVKFAVATNNYELKPTNSNNPLMSFDEASVIYNQFMEKYQHSGNKDARMHPQTSNNIALIMSKQASNRSLNNELEDYIIDHRGGGEDFDDEQVYEDDFLSSDPTDDADPVQSGEEVIVRPNAPLTGEMLQLQLQSTSGKDKSKLSISNIRQVAKKELDDLETNANNNGEMLRMKAKGKVLPKLNKVQPQQQPRIQNHQVAKRVKSNQKNNNLNDSLKGVRSFSAGTYLNNSGNQNNLNESLKGRSKKETKAATDVNTNLLPPLRPILTLPEDAADGHLAPRYIQSAPAVSRSVNLPPITHHLSSATPNGKKVKPKPMMVAKN